MGEEEDSSTAEFHVNLYFRPGIGFEEFGEIVQTRSFEEVLQSAPEARGCA